MSKEIEELMKNRPEVRGQMQQATKEIDTRTMPTQSIEGNPNPRAQDTPNPNANQRVTSPGESTFPQHDNKAMQNAYNQQPVAPKGGMIKKIDWFVVCRNGGWPNGLPSFFMHLEKALPAFLLDQKEIPFFVKTHQPRCE